MSTNSVLDQVRSGIGEGHLCDGCRRHGCRVSLDDIPSPRIIVDADRAFPAHGITGKRCDYVLFWRGGAHETLVTVPLELKSGEVDASEASAQLEQGAAFAARFIPSDITSTCHPILVHGRRFHPYQRRTLNRAKVRFRGQQLTVKTARCNHDGNLMNALPSDARS